MIHDINGTSVPIYAVFHRFYRVVLFNNHYHSPEGQLIKSNNIIPAPPIAPIPDKV